MHPCDAGRPIAVGSLVPWIPTGPPCAQFFSTGENADVPSAAGPHGPSGFAGISRCVT
jgi:hypothetical protein